MQARVRAISYDHMNVTLLHRLLTQSPENQCRSLSMQSSKYTSHFVDDGVAESNPKGIYQALSTACAFTITTTPTSNFDILHLQPNFLPLEICFAPFYNTPYIHQSRRTKISISGFQWSVKEHSLTIQTSFPKRPTSLPNIQKDHRFSSTRCRNSKRII